MASTSSVPAVKAALVDGLVAAIADSNVQVVWGRPADSLVARECIYVADVDLQSNIANIKAGRKHRDERYTVDVVIAVARARGKIQEAEERAFAFLDALEDFLANDPTLTNMDGIVAVTLDSIDETVAYGKEGPVAVLVATVAVHARLI